MTQIEFKDLKKLREEYKDKKIVFCSGVFDLTHLAHILFFEDCKKYGDILVVSVGGDKLIKKIKGENRPIFSENIRLRTIDSLKPVDYCFIEPEYESNNTLYGLNEAFRELKPNVYVVTSDSSNIEYRRKLCQIFETDLVLLERHYPFEFRDMSTTTIIEKIKKLEGLK